MGAKKRNRARGVVKSKTIDVRDIMKSRGKLTKAQQQQQQNLQAVQTGMMQVGAIAYAESARATAELAADTAKKSQQFFQQAGLLEQASAMGMFRAMIASAILQLPKKKESDDDDKP